MSIDLVDDLLFVASKDSGLLEESLEKLMSVVSSHDSRTTEIRSKESL